jgi:hypothetical protein
MKKARQVQSKRSIYSNYILIALLMLGFCSRTFAQIPIIDYFNPAYGPVGTTVTITGNNFGATASANTVYFGSVKANIVTASATQLTVTVPYGVINKPLSVTTNANKTAYSRIAFNLMSSPDSRAYKLDATSFAANVDYPAGLSPKALAVADFNNDGKPDIACVNKDANTVSIFKNTSVNNGAISLAPKIDITTGNTPVSIAVGDINGDGKLDIVVGHIGSNFFSVFINNGLGTTISFTTRVDVTASFVISKVAIADFDLDGLPDIAGTSGGSVYIFKNAGSINAINFTLAATLVSNGGVDDFVAAELLFADKKPDIATVNSFTNSISVFQNNSTPNNFSFSTKVDYATGINPKSISLANLSSTNGFNDLIVSNAGSNSISFFRNNYWNFSVKNDRPSSNNPVFVIAGNLTGNELYDILTISQSNPILLYQFHKMIVLYFQILKTYLIKVF